MQSKSKDIECKYHGVVRHISDKNNTYWRCTKCRNEAAQRHRLRLKLKAITYKGGQCVKCGYNKCPDALEFHHIDPNEKDFSISSDGNNRSWTLVQQELNKCELLCANCHRESHNINNVFCIPEKNILKNICCLQCKKIFKPSGSKQKFCSKRCSEINQRKINRPSIQQLNSDVYNLGYVGTGKKYGVSDNTIRKWLNNNIVQ